MLNNIKFKVSKKVPETKIAKIIVTNDLYANDCYVNKDQDSVYYSSDVTGLKKVNFNNQESSDFKKIKGAIESFSISEKNNSIIITDSSNYSRKIYLELYTLSGEFKKSMKLEGNYLSIENIFNFDGIAYFTFKDENYNNCGVGIWDYQSNDFSLINTQEINTGIKSIEYHLTEKQAILCSSDSIYSYDFTTKEMKLLKTCSVDFISKDKFSGNYITYREISGELEFWDNKFEKITNNKFDPSGWAKFSVSDDQRHVIMAYGTVTESKGNFLRVYDYTGQEVLNITRFQKHLPRKVLSFGEQSAYLICADNYIEIYQQPDKIF